MTIVREAMLVARGGGRRRLLAVLFVFHILLAWMQGPPSLLRPATIPFAWVHAFWFFFALIVFGLGVVERTLRDTTRSERLSLAVITGLAAWVFGAHLLAYTGKFQFFPLVLFVDGLGLAGVALRPAAAGAGISRLESPARWLMFFLCLVILRFGQVDGSFASNVLRPPANYDTIAFYFPAAAQVANSGFLETINQTQTPLRSDPTLQFLPTNWMVLWAAPFVLLPDSDFLANFIQIPALALVLFGVYAACRRAGASQWSSLVLVIILAFQRHMHWRDIQAFGGTDLWIPAVLMLGLVAFFGPVDPPRAVFLGLSLGLASGMKQDGIVVGLPIALISLARPGKRALRAALLLGAAFLAGGHGYARNWIATGNPTYPFPVSVFGAEIFAGLPQPVGTWPRSLWSLDTHLMLFRNDSEFTQWSTMVILAAWLLAFRAAFKRRQMTTVWPALLVPLAIYIVYYGIHPRPFGRRLYPFLAAASIPGALLLDWTQAPRLIGAWFSELLGVEGTSVSPPGWFRRIALGLAIAAPLFVLAWLSDMSGDYVRGRDGRLLGMALWREEAPLWIAVDAATADRPDTIGVVVLNMHHYLGGRLQNTVIGFPRSGMGEGALYRWSIPGENVFVMPERAGFEERLDSLDVGILALGRGCPEEEWAKGLGLTLIAESPVGTIWSRRITDASSLRDTIPAGQDGVAVRAPSSQREGASPR